MKYRIGPLGLLLVGLMTVNASLKADQLEIGANIGGFEMKNYHYTREKEIDANSLRDTGSIKSGKNNPGNVDVPVYLRWAPEGGAFMLYGSHASSHWSGYFDSGTLYAAFPGSTDYVSYRRKDTKIRALFNFVPGRFAVGVGYRSLRTEVDDDVHSTSTRGSMQRHQEIFRHRGPELALEFSMPLSKRVRVRGGLYYFNLSGGYDRKGYYLYRNVYNTNFYNTSGGARTSRVGGEANLELNYLISERLSLNMGIDLHRSMVKVDSPDRNYLFPALSLAGNVESNQIFKIADAVFNPLVKTKSTRDEFGRVYVGMSISLGSPN